MADIRNEQEYRETERRYREAKTRMTEYRKKLESVDKLTLEQVQRSMDPLESFYAGFYDDMKEYCRNHGLPEPVE